jgi:fumarylacetoacetase
VERLCEGAGSRPVTGIDETHDPARSSWVESANGHRDFPVQNLPFGVFGPSGGPPRIGIAIGDRILDLSALEMPSPVVDEAIGAQTLNRLFALPVAERVALRRHVSRLLSEPGHRATVEPLLHDAKACVMHLPATIGDYTDFYVGIHHANNVGRQFRPDNPLLPNYKWVPIGYHGRASSIRPTGVPVTRPNGQRKAPDRDVPTFGPSRRLDYELEMGVWIGAGNELGTPIAIGEAARHVAGLCLLNDWSARDLQAWEYQPLGPFLAKNFHSTISPWVVTVEALAPFRIAQPARPDGDPRPLPYLWDEADQGGGAFAIDLEVSLSTAAMREAGAEPVILSRGPASNMYWTVAQMIAHHTSNGCNLSPGDLLGTGTISAPDRSGFGSLMEISRGGADPVALSSGETRAFLEDGDELTIRGTARAGDFIAIGFGDCSTTIRPART